jgi:membrane protein YqaA with SNARE-associated domain
LAEVYGATVSKDRVVQPTLGAVDSLSAWLAIRPLAVTLGVPATRMSVIPFGVGVLLGRMVLFLA